MRAVAARSAEVARRVVAALVGVALAGSLIIGTAGRASADGLRISVYGDSVLLGASEEISAALAGNDVSIDAHENVSLLGMLPVLDAARATIGDVVVLDLGYNDIADPAIWRDRLDRAAGILDDVPRVIWLTQREFADGRAEMNNELRAVAQLHPNIEVVDWNGLVAANADLVYGDGIHLTPAGQTAMADLVKSRVDAFVAAQVAATSTTAAPTTTSTSAASGATEAVRGTDDRGMRSLRTTRATAGDDLWFSALVAALVAVVIAALTLTALRARRRSRPAG